MIAIKNGQDLMNMRQACKITAAARAMAGEMVDLVCPPRRLTEPFTISS